MLRKIVEHMEQMGWTDYGTYINGDDLRRMIGIEYPESGSRRDFEQIELAELSRIEFIRSILLRKGKYLLRTNGDFRIALPSEHSAIIEKYMRAAKSKLNRAIILGRNSPPDANGIDHALIRAEMMKSQRKRGST